MSRRARSLSVPLGNSVQSSDSCNFCLRPEEVIPRSPAIRRLHGADACPAPCAISHSGFTVARWIATQLMMAAVGRKQTSRCYCAGSSSQERSNVGECLLQTECGRSGSRFPLSAVADTRHWATGATSDGDWPKADVGRSDVCSRDICFRLKVPLGSPGASKDLTRSVMPQYGADHHCTVVNPLASPPLIDQQVPSLACVSEGKNSSR